MGLPCYQREMSVIRAGVAPGTEIREDHVWVQTAPNLNTPALLCKHFQPPNVHSYNTANRVFNPLLELQQL